MPWKAITRQFKGYMFRTCQSSGNQSDQEKKKKSSGDKHSKGSGKEGQWEEGLWLADAEGPGMDATFQRENDGKSLHLQREHEP